MTGSARGALDLARHWLSRDASVLFYGPPGDADPAVIDALVHSVPGRRILAPPRRPTIPRQPTIPRRPAAPRRPTGPRRPPRTLADALSSVHPAEIAGLPSPYREALTGWISGGSPPDAYSASATVASAVLCLLEQLGAATRVLLVLPDLHRADPQSQRVLRLVADRADGLPVHVVAVEEVAEGATPQAHRLCPNPLVMIRLARPGADWNPYPYP
jgi:hypothetical protein